MEKNLNTSAAVANNNAAEIRNEIINLRDSVISYLDTTVEDDGRSEILIKDVTLESNENIGFYIHLVLGNKRNGVRRVKGINFTMGIKGEGSWKTANAENFFDLFIDSDYIDEMVESLENFELEADWAEKTANKVLENLKNISYGWEIWQGHKWNEYDEYDLFSGVTFPEIGVPVKLIKDRIINMIGREFLRRRIAERITWAASDKIAELGNIMRAAQERLDYNAVA